jgi:TetR/AcrR family transcriptional regulator, transcriptional repressor for nem operon
MQINETRSAILDVAQELLQTRGYNAFSIKDLADRVEIRTSSIHYYYFPTKADLCRALISRNRQRVADVLAEIDQQVGDPRRRLERFAAVFQSTIEAGNRMCPFGMLAADSETLEPQSCEELRESFDDLENWLRRVLLEGRKAGVMAFAGSAQHEARLILSTLEGAMLVARTYEDPARFEVVARRLLEKLRCSRH